MNFMYLMLQYILGILAVKYKILSTPLNKLNGETLVKYKGFKDQETKETKGLSFLTETELKNTSLRMDATGKAMLIVLRHLCRIRDLPGASPKKFVVVT